MANAIYKQVIMAMVNSGVKHHAAVDSLHLILSMRKRCPKTMTKLCINEMSTSMIGVVRLEGDATKMGVFLTEIRGIR